MGRSTLLEAHLEVERLASLVRNYIERYIEHRDPGRFHKGRGCRDIGLDQGPRQATSCLSGRSHRLVALRGTIVMVVPKPELWFRWWVVNQLQGLLGGLSTYDDTGEDLIE